MWRTDCREQLSITGGHSRVRGRAFAPRCARRHRRGLPRAVPGHHPRHNNNTCFYTLGVAHSRGRRGRHRPLAPCPASQTKTPRWLVPSAARRGACMYTCSGHTFHARTGEWRPVARRPCSGGQAEATTARKLVSRKRSPGPLGTPEPSLGTMARHVAGGLLSLTDTRLGAQAGSFVSRAPPRVCKPCRVVYTSTGSTIVAVVLQ